MARKTRRQKQQDEVSKEAKTDMTPMIDCVFLLIIFFLCIDFKTLEAKLPAYLPKDKGSQPTKVEPQEQIRLKIILHKEGTKKPRPGASKSSYWVGHEVRYTVGPEAIPDLDALMKKLKDIHKDKSRWVEDKKNPGKMRPQDVVIEPGTGVVYGDVAPTVDTVREAGFEEINFGGGLGSKKEGAYAKKKRK